MKTKTDINVLRRRIEDHYELGQFFDLYMVAMRLANLLDCKQDLEELTELLNKPITSKSLDEEGYERT